MKQVEFIKCMRSAGLPIDVLTKYVGWVQQDDVTIEARKKFLEEQQELIAHLDENISAFAVKLTPEDLREIESAISTVTVQGARYPQDIQRQVNR